MLDLPDREHAYLVSQANWTTKIAWLFYIKINKLIVKVTSAVFVVLFSVNSVCHGLAPSPSSANPVARREILAALERTQIRYAESEDAKAFLSANSASCLLLSCGKYLVTKEVAIDDMRLLRAIIHEDIKAVMKVIAAEDRLRYNGIKELILQYVPPGTDNTLPPDLYVNHTVARAFEWLTLIEDRIVLRDEVPAQELYFLDEIRPIIMANRHNYFTAEFWDQAIRGKKIRDAIRRGTRFYQAASVSSEPGPTVPDTIPLDRLRPGDPVGGKARSFEKFHEVGLAYPEGICITIPAVDRIVNGDRGSVDAAARQIIDYFSRNKRTGSVRTNVSVRSSPDVSMPGVLETVLNVPCDKEALKDAIRRVALSWDTDNARAYRRFHQKEHGAGMGIVVQGMVDGEHGNSCSGVVFSRDPATGGRGVFGTYMYRTSCKDIVSGKISGEPAERMREKFPGIYSALQAALVELESYLGYPQEVEFTVENGVLYFLQTRDMKLDPLPELKLLSEMSGKGTTFPRIVAFQTQAGNRKVFSVNTRDTLSEPAVRCHAYVSGAALGKVVFDIDAAKQAAAAGKGAIFVITSQTSYALDDILAMKHIGIIKTSGNPSSHDMVLARAARIPTVILPEGFTAENNSLIYRGNAILRRGDEAGINDGCVYAGPSAVSVLRAAMREIDIVGLLPYGIDVLALEKEVRASCRSGDTWKVSYEELLRANVDKHAEFKKYERTHDQRSMYRANLEKHFLHVMLQELGKVSGKSDADIRNDHAVAIMAGRAELPVEPAAQPARAGLRAPGPSVEIPLNAELFKNEKKVCELSLLLYLTSSYFLENTSVVIGDHDMNKMAEDVPRGLGASYLEPVAFMKRYGPDHTKTIRISANGRQAERCLDVLTYVIKHGHAHPDYPIAVTIEKIPSEIMQEARVWSNMPKDEENEAMQTSEMSNTPGPHDIKIIAGVFVSNHYGWFTKTYSMGRYVIKEKERRDNGAGPFLEAINESVEKLAALKPAETSVLFDVDNTLLRFGETLDDDSAIREQILWFISKGFTVGIVSGNSRANNKRRFSDVIIRELKKTGGLQLMKHVCMYSNGGATRTVFDEYGNETAEKLDGSIRELGPSVASIQEVLKKYLRSRFDLPGDEVRKFREWYSAESRYTGSQEKVYGTRPDFKGSIFDISWLAGAEADIPVFTVDPFDVAGSSVKNAIPSPWIENRDGVQIAIGFIPGLKNAEGRDIRSDLIEELRQKVRGTYVVGFATIDIVQVTKAAAIKDHLARAGARAKNAVYIGDSFGPGGNDEPAAEIDGLTIFCAHDDLSRLSPAVAAKGAVLIGKGTDATERFLSRWREKVVAKEALLDIYDTDELKVLWLDVLQDCLRERSLYKIKYDVSRLSGPQIEIIKEYVDLLNMKTESRFEAAGCSSLNGSKEALITVYRQDKTGNVIGKGCVDIDIPGDDAIGLYALRVTGMLNIALAASNIKESFPDDTRSAITGFIKRQCRLIVGDSVAIPEDPEDLIKFIRNLPLPAASRLPAEKIEEYNRRAKEAILTAA